MSRMSVMISRRCEPLRLISPAYSMYFFAMSVYGWYEWKRGGERHEGA